jgi:hypothetical protein
LRHFLASLYLFAFFRAAVFAQNPLPPLQAGLCVVFPATSATDLVARSREGRVLVHALTPDAALADQLRKAIAAEGLSGQVSVMVWNESGELPYADDLVDELVIDRDTLAGKGPSQAEIDRVLIPQFGVARIHEKGVWKDYRWPMPGTYGEWTHYYHDATNNPVGTDQVATVATGLRWLAEAQVSGGSYQLVGNGRLVHITGNDRSGFGGDGKAHWEVIRVRSAFNGLPRWELTKPNARDMPTRRYEGAVLDGDRLIRLRSSKGPLVAVSMVDGKELMAFDAITITNNAESVRIPATTGGGVDAMVIIEGRTLYVANGNTLSAVNADSGKLLWRFTADAGVYLGFPCIDRKTGTLAIALGPLGMASGRQTHFRAVEYRGFDAVTGAQRWVTPNPISDFIASMATLDGSVYVATAGHLGSLVLSMIGMDARTGEVRWKQLDMPIGASGTMMLFPDRGYIGRSALSGFVLSDGKHLGRFPIGNSRCDVPRASATTINNFGHLPG